MATKRALIIALACGLLIAVLTWLYLNSLEEKYRQETKPLPVVITRGYIPKGTILKDRMVQIAKVPKQYIQPGAFTSINEFTDGKKKSRYITLLPILENEQIIMSKLADIKKEMGLSGIIPEGKTAVPLPVDEIATLGGLVQPGNHINVLCTFDYEEKGKSYSSTVALFQNVEILSVGNKIIGTTWQTASGKTDTFGGETSPSVITLALTPAEASLLTFAREKGNITLVLRPTDDETTKDIPPVKIGNIIPGAGKKKITSMDGAKALKYIEQLQKQALNQFSTESD